MKPILLTVPGNPANQDRGLIVHDGPRIVLCVADGAGGRSGGAEAASMAVDLARQNASLLSTGELCAEVLRKMDTAIAKDPTAGETTCVLAILTPEDIFGASVGDSGGWLIPENGAHRSLVLAAHGRFHSDVRRKSGIFSSRLTGCSNTRRQNE
jgi:serine/threonine protein phosphatase PrpC